MWLWLYINSTSENKINNIKISESLPYVNISTTQKDKKVFGVIARNSWIPTHTRAQENTLKRVISKAKTLILVS